MTRNCCAPGYGTGGGSYGNGRDAVRKSLGTWLSKESKLAKAERLGLLAANLDDDDD
jgi:hypothetical protein